MIRFTHYEDYNKTGEETVVDLSLGQAVNSFLTEYGKVQRPNVYVDSTTVHVSEYSGTRAIPVYQCLYNTDDDCRDFTRLERLARLMQTMTVGHDDEHVHKKLLDIDLGVIIRAAAYQARDLHITMAPTKESYSSYQAILQFAIEWLVGCGLSRGGPDDLAAALLALESELDGQASFEQTLRELAA